MQRFHGAASFLDGQDLPFSSTNALMLYQRFPWIKEQVDKAAGSRARFLADLKKASAAPSDKPAKS